MIRGASYLPETNFAGQRRQAVGRQYRSLSGMPKLPAVCAAKACRPLREGSVAVKGETPLRLSQPQPLPFSVVFNEDDTSRLEGAAKLGDGGPLCRQWPGLGFKPAHRDVGDARRLGESLLVPTEQHPAGTYHFGRQRSADLSLDTWCIIFIDSRLGLD